ncbi:MAG: hypothetical protein ACLTSX_01870 [Collinsella sp.]
MTCVVSNPQELDEVHAIRFLQHPARRPPAREGRRSADRHQVRR